MIDERALALEHLGRMIKEGRYLDTGAHISSQVLKSLLIAREALGAQKEGKWTFINRDTGNVDMVCSVCGEVGKPEIAYGYPAEEIEKAMIGDTVWKTNFCPHCGARMVTDDE